MNTEQQLQISPTESVFSLQHFEHAQRVAKMIAVSSLVPEAYKGKIENVMIAMEMANRMSISPLMVMQNLYIVKGNPGWSGQFVIGIINNSKRFGSELEFVPSGDGDHYGYEARTKGENPKKGTKVDWKMVKGEGWLDKPGSKWKTMPEQMFKYRAAALFGREHCPDLLMGMQTAEELYDTNMPKTIEVIDELELRELFESKRDKLKPEEIKNYTRILEKEETISYHKMKKELESK